MQRLTSFLSGSPALRTMAQKVGQLAVLEQVYHASIPRTLAQSSHLAGFERQNLVVGAENGAIAAKLRQLAPHILNMIQENHPEITGILIRVQVGNRPRPAAHKAVSLGPNGKKKIADLAASLDNSPLKSALQRLSKR